MLHVPRKPYQHAQLQSAINEHYFDYLAYVNVVEAQKGVLWTTNVNFVAEFCLE